jgi:CubicO group peptidase (beta-lactamase class C family)
MAEIKGAYDEQFKPVADQLAAYLKSGEDIGASVAVFIDGEAVVDIYGGNADEAKTKEWQSDTIVNTFSTTKTMTALSMLILADRGVVDLDEKVTKYWPEYGQKGKENTLVKHLLGHSAGMPGWTEPATVEDICDLDIATEMLAKQAPWWEPGTAIGYHPITFGPLISEVIRRATDKTLTQFFNEEVAGAIGADFQIGVRPEDDDRISNMIQSSPIRPRAGDGTMTDLAFFNPYVYPQTSATTTWRRAELGGSNGHGNAKGAAMVQHVLACGGEAFGKRLLSKEGVERALEVIGEGSDMIAGFAAKWGMGYALNNQTLATLFPDRFTGHRIAVWGGSGGSLAFNDFDERMTIAYVMNKHVEDQTGLGYRGIEYVKAVYDALKGKRTTTAAR